MAAPRQLVLVLLFALAVVTSSQADTLTFQQGDGGAYSETAATTINKNTTFNFGSAAVLTVVTLDVQSLIRFPDIIGDNPGQIPPGSTINSATLHMTIYTAPIGIAATNIHRINVPWDENTVTGQGFYAIAGPLWGPLIGTMPGADPLGLTSADVTVLVQDWADGETNFGLMLRLETPPTPEEGFSHCQYNSDDATELSWRPKLSVEFTPPEVAVEPTTWGRVKALYR